MEQLAIRKTENGTEKIMEMMTSRAALQICMLGYLEQYSLDGWNIKSTGSYCTWIATNPDGREVKLEGVRLPDLVLEIPARQGS